MEFLVAGGLLFFAWAGFWSGCAVGYRQGLEDGKRVRR